MTLCERELKESARLLGMSAEREMSLLARIAELERELSKVISEKIIEQKEQK